jgi:hypothetical protein
MITVHCRVLEGLGYGNCKRPVALEMMIGWKESDQCFSIDRIKMSQAVGNGRSGSAIKWLNEQITGWDTA